MTRGSPFTENPPVACAHDVEPPAHVVERRFVHTMPQVVIFGHADDDVHHIRETAAADAALAELVIDFGGYDKLPGIRFEEPRHDLFDIAIRDDIAVTDEHWQRPLNTAALDAPHT
jgi:hypothetical protein